ncbi:uncharacterized protein LOC106880369 [Octopus bimaculoides]|nr:uncharacterized protein LOC106880369 [Octopus bimaculoides]|eukprot:XP_014785741.1 PREDICTED: uncharacterized protein LOC106880369 [Octopus bimaculoides]
MVFDGRNTTLESWFSLGKLRSSPWCDLPQSTIRFFTIRLHTGRRFYVSSSDISCERVTGWFAVVQTSPCVWERLLQLPALIYSGEDSKINWNNGFETADSMAIFIRLKP